MDNYYKHKEGMQRPEASLGLYLQYINFRRFGCNYWPEELLTSGLPYNGRHIQTRQPEAIAQETAHNRNFAPGPPHAPNINKQPRKSHPVRRPAKPYGLVYQKLFADPGLYYRLPLEPFFVELRNQMQAPERMEPDSLIDVLIQIYRIYRPIVLKQLAYVELGDPAMASSFHVLAPKKASILGVYLKGPINSVTKKPAQILRPGNHIFRLSLMSDPSAEVDKDQNKAHSPSDDSDAASDSI